jgi:hypothetical protein
VDEAVGVGAVGVGAVVVRDSAEMEGVRRAGVAPRAPTPVALVFGAAGSAGRVGTVTVRLGWAAGPPVGDDAVAVLFAAGPAVAVGAAVGPAAGGAEHPDASAASTPAVASNEATAPRRPRIAHMATTVSVRPSAPARAA